MPQQPSSGEAALGHHHESTAQSSDANGVDNDDKNSAIEQHSYEAQVPSHVQHHHNAHVHTMNGNAAQSLPPQQVYVNPSGIPVAPMVPHQIQHPTTMSGLEHQFHSMGLRQEEATAASTEPSSTQTNPNENAEDEDDEDDRQDALDENAEEDEEPVKLFVGQVTCHLCIRVFQRVCCPPRPCSLQSVFAIILLIEIDTQELK